MGHGVGTYRIPKKSTFAMTIQNCVTDSKENILEIVLHILRQYKAEKGEQHWNSVNEVKVEIKQPKERRRLVSDEELVEPLYNNKAGEVRRLLGSHDVVGPSPTPVPHPPIAS